MKLPNSWTKVTTLSKILAMALFVLLPFVGFYLGTKYQQAKNMYQISIEKGLANQSITPTFIPYQEPPTLKPIPTIVDSPGNIWTKYSDNQMGISFRYPDQLLVEKKSDSSIIVWLDKDKTDINSIRGYETVHFNPYQYFAITKINTSFSDWYRQNYENKPEGYLGIPIKKLDIPGKEVYFHRGDGIGEGTFDYIFVMGDSNLIDIRTYELSKTIDQDPVFKKIIYSLQFNQ